VPEKPYPKLKMWLRRESACCALGSDLSLCKHNTASFLGCCGYAAQVAITSGCQRITRKNGSRLKGFPNHTKQVDKINFEQISPVEHWVGQTHIRSFLPFLMSF
jgi:hypothetical protein